MAFTHKGKWGGEHISVHQTRPTGPPLVEHSNRIRLLEEMTKMVNELKCGSWKLQKNIAINCNNCQNMRDLKHLIPPSCENDYQQNKK